MSTATEVISVTFSGLSLGLAGWAAVTAEQARAWQRRRDEEQRETRVLVEFVHSTGPQRPWPMVATGALVSPSAPIRYTVTLVVINAGETTEYVAAAFFEPSSEVADRPGLRVYGDEGFEGSTPYELPPRARLNVPIDLGANEIEWMRGGFVAEVWLGSGARIESPVEHLHDDLLQNL
jgi:hypothetical protein